MKASSSLFFLMIYFLVAIQPACSVQLRTIAITGMQAPGNAPGVTLDFFSNVVLGAEGQVAFHAFMSGLDTDLENNTGIFAETANGNLRK